VIEGPAPWVPYLCVRSGGVYATVFSAQFLHQGSAIHSQQLSCTILVAAGPLQRLIDQPLLKLGEEQAQVDAVRGQVDQGWS